LNGEQALIEFLTYAERFKYSALLYYLQKIEIVISIICNKVTDGRVFLK